LEAGYLRIFAHTNRYSKHEPPVYIAVGIALPYYADDTFTLVSQAKRLLTSVFKEHVRYHKCGVLLCDLRPKAERQASLFDRVQPQQDALMQAMDHLNHTYGKNTVRVAAMGYDQGFRLNCNYRSPRYTTHWDEVPTIWAR
jgi:DNA polymerase V